MKNTEELFYVDAVVPGVELEDDAAVARAVYPIVPQRVLGGYCSKRAAVKAVKQALLAAAKQEDSPVYTVYENLFTPTYKEFLAVDEYDHTLFFITIRKYNRRERSGCTE